MARTQVRLPGSAWPRNGDALKPPVPPGLVDLKDKSRPFCGSGFSAYPEHVCPVTLYHPPTALPGSTPSHTHPPYLPEGHTEAPVRGWTLVPAVHGALEWRAASQAERMPGVRVCVCVRKCTQQKPPLSPSARAQLSGTVCVHAAAQLSPHQPTRNPNPPARPLHPRPPSASMSSVQGTSWEWDGRFFVSGLFTEPTVCTVPPRGSLRENAPRPEAKRHPHCPCIRPWMPGCSVHWLFRAVLLRTWACTYA